MEKLAEGEIVREARRVFRLMSVPGAFLVRQLAGDYRVMLHGAERFGGLIPAAVVDAFARRGWIRRAGEEHPYVMSDAGCGWFAREMAGESPFAAQHQIRVGKRLREGDGVICDVTVNAAESPLARLHHKNRISGLQFDAGEKLRRDFTMAQLAPRLGLDLTAPFVGGKRGYKRDTAFMSDAVVAAKQRFAKAMKAVGPGLSDVLFDVVCHLRDMQEAERARNWPHRSSLVVLSLALDRLALHYGMPASGKAQATRIWRKRDDTNEEDDALNAA